MKQLVPNVRTRHLLLVWIVVFTALTVYALHQSSSTADASHALIIENQQRIADIQKSRVASCEQTYEGIRQVFKPFFPPPPRSAAQQADLDKFNRTIAKRKAQCVKQTKADP